VQLTDFHGDDGLELSGLAFSPSGGQLLFVRGNAPNKAGVSANPAQLQMATDRQIYLLDLSYRSVRLLSRGNDPVWSPSGNEFLFLLGGQVQRGVKSGDSYQVNPLFRVNGSVSQLSYSPNGSKLAFRLSRGQHAFIGIYDSLDGKITFPDPSADRDSDPVWHPSGAYLAFVRTAPVRFNLPFSPRRSGYPWQIRMLDMQAGTAKEIWRAAEGRGSVFADDLPVTDHKLLWSQEGYLLFPWEKDGWLHIYARRDSDGSVRNLTPGEGEVENWLLSRNGKQLFISSNHGDIERRHLRSIQLADGKMDLLVGGSLIAWSPQELSEGVAFLQSSAQRPAWPHRYHEGKAEPLAADRFPGDFPRNLAEPEQITLTAADGFRSYAHILKPAGLLPGKKVPAVIFLHGGSRRQMLAGFHHGLYYSHAYALNQYFASRGYMVLVLNFRSGTGYGLDFREALGYGATGASEVGDLVAAARYLAGRVDVDASAISLWGGSYGGYLTAHGLAQFGGLFRCGVDIHGVHDWNDEIPTFAPWYDPKDYPESAALARRSSPAHYAAGWTDPVLFIHGDDDRNVPFSETMHILEILRRQGVLAEQLVFPDEVHSFLLHRNWVKAYEATFAFIDRHTRAEK